MDSKKKIALFFPYFIKGGSDVVVAQTIEALKGTYDISIITCDTYEKIEMLNVFCGTNILPQDITIINPPFSSLLRKIPGFGLLKYHLLILYIKLSRLHFDVLIGMYKEIDFGRVGIQCIHVPELDKTDQNASGSSIMYYQNSVSGNLYKKFCYKISGFQQERMKKNVTIVDSVWAKTMVAKTLGIESVVMYPPVTSVFPYIPFKQKEHSFVYLGRITPAKEVDKLIRIVAKAREKIPSIQLHIGGVFDQLNMDYGKSIKNMCNRNSEWCFFDGQINHDKKAEFLASYQYGISGCINEAFGIAVVEMVKAGSIVFVPEGGGQVEIVNAPELMYKDEDDAVAKIAYVLGNETLRKHLLSYLTEQGKRFSKSLFQEDVRNIVVDFLEKHGK